MSKEFAAKYATDEQSVLIQQTRLDFDNLLDNLETRLPVSGRYIAIVRTKLEEACMFAIKGIVGV